MISGTIERWGAMLAGQPVDAFYASVAHADLLSIGLNCATGPDLMTDHIRTLAQMASTRISCYPNAGLPNEEDKYLETPESLAAQLEKFVEHGWLNIVGGCCGTTPAHIRAIAQMAEGNAPRAVQSAVASRLLFGNRTGGSRRTNRPLIVGERTNVIGSRLFKKMIAEEKWEEASEIARWQVKNGAHIIDVCLQSSDREELQRHRSLLRKLMPKIKAPVMIDTTDPTAIEQRARPGARARASSTRSISKTARRNSSACARSRKAYGAALVVGTIDEDKQQAQAFTRERKLAVAQRSVELLTGKYGIPPEDIIIDPLVFPCATGDENYIGGAVETIEAIRLIKENIPYVKTILGVSNISFGLPAAAREVVNSVFLYYATKAGLDLAIVNAEKLERFASIPVEERRLAENLLFNTRRRRDDPCDRPKTGASRSREQKIAINQFHIAAITEHFRKAGKKEKKKAAELPLDERLANYIIEGTKDGLIPDLDRKLQEGAGALEIINGPLMAGMTEVGRLFNNNELIVAEVLQSAEAMKAAVGHLEQFMEKSETSTRGKIVLATVKGDVHDIGKNLVEIILANNGYQVINLGIKVPPEDLIQRLAGASAGRDRPVRAAGEERASDGDHGVGFQGSRRERAAAGGRRGAFGKIHDHAHRSGVWRADVLCQGRDDRAAHHERADGPGDARRRAQHAYFHHRRAAPVESAAPAINSGHSAQPQSPHRYSDSRGSVSRPPRARDSRISRRSGATSIRSCCTAGISASRAISKSCWPSATPRRSSCINDVEDVKQRSREVHEDPRRLAVLRSRARRQRRSICSSRARRSPLHTFHFGRQPKSDGLCLSDYILDAEDGHRDHLAMFVVTRGRMRAVALRRSQAARRISAGARAAGAGDRNRRRLRRVAASPHPRGLGLSRSADHDHAGALHLTLSRQALQLRLSGVSRIWKISRACGSCCSPKKSA